MSANIDAEEEWSDSKFRQVVMRGYKYREPYTLELWGEEIDMQLKPLTTTVYRNLLTEIKRDMSDDEFNGMMEKMRDIDEDMSEEEIADEVGASVAVGQVGAVVEAARFGIDPASVGLPHQKAVADTVNRMIGTKAVNIGAEVMNLTDDLESAKEFPGSRTGE